MKKSSTKGFTLAELLIVVAIIAVLVLVAIPVFTASLKRSKAATDEANARSLYAAMQADYLAYGKVEDSQIVKNLDAKGGTITYTSSDGTTKNEFKFSDVTGSGVEIETDPISVTITFADGFKLDDQASISFPASAGS